MPSRSFVSRGVRRVAAAVMAVVLSAEAAAAACYAEAEFDAEQTIRLHTELMVVGLTCHQFAGSGTSAFQQYQDFTNRHADVIRDAEKRLVAFFRKHEKGNPTRHLDDLRTGVANEVSRRAALVTARAYCNRQAEVVAEAMAMSEDELRRHLADPRIFRVAARPLCSAPPRPVPASARLPMPRAKPGAPAR